MIFDRATGCPEFAHECQKVDRCRDAVLVADLARVDEVPEGLLVSVGEVRRTGDPLETGKGLGEVEPESVGDCTQRRRADERGSEGATLSRGREALCGTPAEQVAHLVAGEASPSAVHCRNRDGQAIGVGIVGDDEVDPRLRGSGHREVEGAGLLRVRECDGRERGIRFLLFDHRHRAAEARSEEHAGRRLESHPVHGRVDERGRSGCGRESRRLRDIRVDDALRGGPVFRRPRQVGDRQLRRDPVDVRGDLGVDGSDDLRPGIRAAEVDLVSVVGRRVVARRHHHTRTDIEVPHREGENRRWEQARQQHGAHARARHDLSSVFGENSGVGAPVVADHHAWLTATTEQPGCEPRRRLRNQHAIHARGTRADLTAEARGTELEPGGEATAEGGCRGSIRSPLGVVDQARQFGSRRLVGVLCEPRAGSRQDLGP